MLDIVLIQLPNPALENPKMYQPLGILYLAAVCEQKGFLTEIVDLRDGYKPFPEARFYGFSCTTPEITEAKRLAKLVKGKTIVGGPHPSLLPNDCEGFFDYIVIGEGEEVLPRILKGEYPKGIVTASRIKNLDDLPFPLWHKIDKPFTETLFPGERYGSGEQAATLTASRGCPFACSFCGNLFRIPVVYRGVENIISELKALIKLGVNYFRFEDDNLTLYPEFERLCQELEKLNIKYKGHTRTDLLAEGQAELLKASGCEELGAGLESADNLVLKKNNKRETLLDHFCFVARLREAKIRSKVYWMAGLPGETDRTLRVNKAFMQEMKPAKWTISTFTPYPGCDAFNYPDKYDIEIINKDWATWWNFAIPIPGKDLPGREGFRHILKGQSIKEMTRRHDDFRNYLISEEWKK